MLISIFITMIVIVISIIVGFYFVITRILREHNPNKCYVFSYYEHELLKPKKGKKVETVSRGTRYLVKGKYLDVPKSYPTIWHKKRITFLVDIKGKLITSFDEPLIKKFTFQDGDKDDLQFELGTSNLVTQAVRAFKGKNDVMIMIIAIIIFAVGGILGYAVGKMTTQPKTITQVVTVNMTAPQPTTPYIQK